MRSLIGLFILLFAIVIHEYAHGWVAWRLGDITAKLAGRLTLNPLAHIDPIGTVLLPAMLMIMNFPVIFGWARPVPVDFASLNNPKKDIIWVGLSGPIANLFLAILLSFILKLFIVRNGYYNPLIVVLNTAILTNLVFAIFNLIPIPPLDGSRVMIGLLPRDLAIIYSRLEPYGFIIIFSLLYLGIVGKIIWPFITYLAQILGVTL